MEYNDNDLRKYIPKVFVIGPYEYFLEITNLNRSHEQLHGECDFNERKIRLSENLNYDLRKPNWHYTVEVLWHELIHAYNLNTGILDNNGLKKLKIEEIEEFFTDINSRHIIHILKTNPELAIILYFFYTHR